MLMKLCDLLEARFAKQTYPDDEIAIRELLQELLKDQYNIIVAENGDQAIKKINGTVLVKNLEIFLAKQFTRSKC